MRLRYGLGCQREHAVWEIALGLELSPSVIAKILDEAQERLADAGLTARQLRAAARGHLASCEGGPKPDPFRRARHAGGICRSRTNRQF